MALSKNADIFYKISGKYSSSHERSLKWDDYDLKIKWPSNNFKPIISKKDKLAKSLKCIEEEL